MIWLNRVLRSSSVFHSSNNKIILQQHSLKSAAEKAIEYVEKAPRICLQDLRDNPGARTAGKQVKKRHNQAGHTIGELQRAPKPPLGWVWGDWYKPWQRMFPGDKRFNGDINIRREYIPLSLVELQRIVDLGWLDTTRLIDVSILSGTRLFEGKFKPGEWRQFGIHLTDEGEETLSTPMNIEVQWASLTAIAAIERAGGRIRTAYYDLESLEAAENAEKWFKQGKPIPRRKFPPHSLYNYYSDPDYRGYLANPDDILKSRARLAQILGYELPEQSTINNSFAPEEKRPEQVFLGLEPGQLVSLADEKVFEPVHHVLVDFYKGVEQQFSDHLR